MTDGTETLAMAGLSQKWRFYASKYGWLHAACRYAGTKAPAFWRLVGKPVTARYLRTWMGRPGPKVLNLGGGGHCTDQFLTADVDPRADVFVDMTKTLPFASASFDGVFLEEAIEHVPKPAALAMLRECARICRQGAAIRITTPDLDWFCRNYLGAPASSEEINEIFYGHGHAHIYGRAELADTVRSCGFDRVVHSSYQDAGSRLGYLDTHSDRFGHPPDMSQYVEGTRP